MTRFGLAVLVLGVLASLLAAIVEDHRLTAVERRVDLLAGRVVCRLPPAPVRPGGWEI